MVTRLWAPGGALVYCVSLEEPHPEVPEISEDDPLLCGGDDPLGLGERVGVQGDAVDSLLHEELRELGIDRGSLSADAHVLAVLVGDLDELRDGPLDPLVPLVEVSHVSPCVRGCPSPCRFP